MVDSIFGDSLKYCVCLEYRGQRYFVPENMLSEQRIRDYTLDDGWHKVIATSARVQNELISDSNQQLFFVIKKQVGINVLLNGLGKSFGKEIHIAATTLDEYCIELNLDDFLQMELSQLEASKFIVYTEKPEYGDYQFLQTSDIKRSDLPRLLNDYYILDGDLADAYEAILNYLRGDLNNSKLFKPYVLRMTGAAGSGKSAFMLHLAEHLLNTVGLDFYVVDVNLAAIESVTDFFYVRTSKNGSVQYVRTALGEALYKGDKPIMLRCNEGNRLVSDEATWGMLLKLLGEERNYIRTELDKNGNITSEYEGTYNVPLLCLFSGNAGRQHLVSKYPAAFDKRVSIDIIMPQTSNMKMLEIIKSKLKEDDFDEGFIESVHKIFYKLLSFINDKEPTNTLETRNLENIFINIGLGMKVKTAFRLAVLNGYVQSEYGKDIENLFNTELRIHGLMNA